jgi:hypothetical protein
MYSERRFDHLALRRASNAIELVIPPGVTIPEAIRSV